MVVVAKVVKVVAMSVMVKIMAVAVVRVVCDAYRNVGKAGRRGARETADANRSEQGEVVKRQHAADPGIMVGWGRWRMRHRGVGY